MNSTKAFGRQCKKRKKPGPGVNVWPFGQGTIALGEWHSSATQIEVRSTRAVCRFFELGAFIAVTVAALSQKLFDR